MATELKALVGPVLRRVKQQARQLDQGVQRVVEIISPGAIQGEERWDADKQQAAERTVQRALAAWKAQQREMR